MTEEPLTDYAITEAMLKYGGGFVADLAALFRRGDSENQAILKAAFPHYWREYAELVELKQPPRCPVCGSYAWTYRGDAQVCSDCGR